MYSVTIPMVYSEIIVVGLLAMGVIILFKVLWVLVRMIPFF